MKIGVVSDTHDRLAITAVAIRLLCGRGAELILHCGDIESPETVRLFTGVPTHFVFGNWDKDRKGLLTAIADVGGRWHDDLKHRATLALHPPGRRFILGRGLLK